LNFGSWILVLASANYRTHFERQNVPSCNSSFPTTTIGPEFCRPFASKRGKSKGSEDSPPAHRLRFVETRLKRFTDLSDTAALGALSSQLSGPSQNLFAIPAAPVQ
jgi:hypothetical protein